MILDSFAWFLDSIPLLRKGWRWLWERQMEIELAAPHSRGGPTSMNIEDEGAIYHVRVGPNSEIFLWADLHLINHRPDRRERIISGELHLKRRHWRLWRKTLHSTGVFKDEGSGVHFSKSTPLGDINLEPMSGPTKVTVYAQEPLDIPSRLLPRYMEFVMDFRMVGPMRHYRKVIHKFRHDPNMKVE